MINLGSGLLDAGWRTFFLLMFRFQKAGISKFSASGLLETDGPAPDALALLEAGSSGSGRRLLGTSGFYPAKAVCPQILAVGRKLRTSSFLKKSHQKEKSSPSS